MSRWLYQKRAPKEARTGHDGFVYDSKTEMDRYYYLKILERAKEITNLKRQVEYKLQAPGEHWPIMTGKNRTKIAVYTADFVYFDHTGKKIIEDTKGYDQESSKFRIRVFESFYRCRVTIVTKEKGGQWKVSQ